MKRWVWENFSTVEWFVGIGVTLLAVLAWGMNREVGDGDMSLLQIFPIFGLVAFGLMWSHYILGTLRRLVGRENKKKDAYWVVSAGLVLALIILHPILLNAALIEAGYGLPLTSYFTAYGQYDGWYVVLGTVTLVLLLLFELHRWFKDRSWWKWVERIQIVAMIAIFIHATRLGGEIAHSWYAGLWWAMGLTLVGAWVYNWKYDNEHQSRRDDGGAKK